MQNTTAKKIDTRKLALQILNDEFSNGYITAMFWTSEDEIGDLGIYDMSLESLQRVISDCESFQRENDNLLLEAGDDSQNGHDLWLTRSKQGCGYWDRGYDDIVGARLTEASQAMGEIDLIQGDDKQLHLEG